MNPGKIITLSFVLFATFIGILVAVCMRQDVNLVAADYYRQELQHGEKMTAVANASALSSVPTIRFNGDAVQVNWDNLNGMENGELQLLRPSDPHLDRSFNLSSTSESFLSFPLQGSHPGLYRARLSWSMGGKDYLVEQVLVR